MAAVAATGSGWTAGCGESMLMHFFPGKETKNEEVQRPTRGDRQPADTLPPQKPLHTTVTMAGGFRFLSLVRPFMSVLPEVAAAERKIPFRCAPVGRDKKIMCTKGSINFHSQLKLSRYHHPWPASVAAASRVNRAIARRAVLLPMLSRLAGSVRASSRSEREGNHAYRGRHSVVADGGIALRAAVAASLAGRVAGEGHADLAVAPVVQRVVLVALIPHVARAPGIRALPAKSERLSSPRQMEMASSRQKEFALRSRCSGRLTAQRWSRLRAASPGCIQAGR